MKEQHSSDINLVDSIKCVNDSTINQQAKKDIVDHNPIYDNIHFDINPIDCLHQSIFKSTRSFQKTLFTCQIDYLHNTKYQTLTSSIGENNSFTTVTYSGNINSTLLLLDWASKKFSRFTKFIGLRQSSQKCYIKNYLIN